jgi:hypothetical protein
MRLSIVYVLAAMLLALPTLMTPADAVDSLEVAGASVLGNSDLIFFPPFPLLPIILPLLNPSLSLSLRPRQKNEACWMALRSPIGATQSLTLRTIMMEETRPVKHLSQQSRWPPLVRV